MVKAVPQHAGDGRGYHGFDDVDIVCDPRHQDPGFFLVKKRQGQILDMVIEHVPKPADDSLAHITHEIFLAVHAESAKQINHDDGHGNQREHPDILVEKNIIQNRFDQKCGGGCCGRHDQHAQHGQKKPEPVVFYQIKEAFVSVFEQESGHVGYPY